MDVRVIAPDLSERLVKEHIRLAKKHHYKELTFTAEPLVGPYLTLDLNNYDEEGNEIL